MFERPKAGERAVLVHLDMLEEKDREDPRELTELALSAGAEPVALVTGTRNQPSPRYFVGSGKLEEVRAAVIEHEAEVVLFNHSLTPSQERNLEKDLQVRVLDRTGLILDIFAQRARTHEGKLQVELAQLEHLSTRLVRGWTHLERQKGGIGLRGPGETQLETDRRLIRGRIKSIHKRLEKVRKQREQGRRARRRAEVPTISLVGYTNAGKSTLFNRMSLSDVYAADQLFATLDPTLRRINLENYGPVVLADTVGFIRHLPHKLVDAFRATLEETCNASLLLHVVDASDPKRRENIEQVEDVLKEIGADDIPSLFVFNKVDRLEAAEPRLELNENGEPVRVWVSAVTGDGLELLEQATGKLLGADMVDETLCIPPALGRLRAKLYEREAVLSEEVREDGSFSVHIKMPKTDWLQIAHKEGVKLEQLTGHVC
ncbi:GTPase HflX [Hahella sp. CR1]|uniref:ribosome rescue GTPase HflX n=1 Tax=Hahella sp. CR1 TaxID=2992807 RepID=UPI0024425B2C|nr:ribosome rescue GTPase HflX [Hahella sp. CR1]MDG9671117.1 GTPase HflX [Hahella sp. CR1]